MTMDNKLDVLVKEMRSFGEYLMPYNFPRVPQPEEDDMFM
jgi:hypothetical protein